MSTSLFLYYYNATNYTHEFAPDIVSADEHACANAFAFAALKHDYLLRHRLLRLVLARHLRCEPADIVFLKNSQGKPYLKNTPLHFNLSSSNEHILIGVHPTHPIGVDIETMKPLDDMKSILDIIASKEEQALFHTLSPAQQSLAFYQLWSRKEAVLKALGTGFHTDASSITLSFIPHHPPQILAIQDDDPQAWTLFSRQFSDNTVASACVRDRHTTLHIQPMTGQLQAPSGML
jgi:4'-phosphopantetheinyl transferase